VVPGAAPARVGGGGGGGGGGVWAAMCRRWPAPPLAGKETCEVLNRPFEESPLLAAQAKVIDVGCLETGGMGQRD